MLSVFQGNDDNFRIRFQANNKILKHQFCSKKFIIFQYMENSRRTLRTKNHCQQINNIFSQKIGENQVTDQIPAQIMKKIGKLHKISCCHINDLPQLFPSKKFQLQLEKCRLVQEFQKLCPTEYSQNSAMQLEKTTGYEQFSKNISKPDSLIEQCFSQCLSHQKKKQKKKIIETTVESMELLKDREFLQILNQFVMLGDKKIIAMDEQLFEK